MATALRFVFRIKSKMHQRIVPLARLHDDVATLAAVAPRRPSARNILFPPERKASVPAVPGFHANCGFVNEHKNVVGRQSLVVGQNPDCRSATDEPDWLIPVVSAADRG